MKIAIAAEFSSVDLKDAVLARLREEGYDVTDLCPQAAEQKVQYYEAASVAARAIQRGEYDRGVVICGSGAGVSLIANKFKGVYCVACESVFTAERIGLVNNANLLAMGGQVVSHTMGGEMAVQYLRGEWCKGFNEERRERNVNGFRILQQIEADGGTA